MLNGKHNLLSRLAQVNPLLWAGFFMLVNLIFKLLYADQNSLYLDEVASAWYTQMDWNGFTDFLKKDGSPPLYYLLVRGWTSIWGDSVLALRSLSIIFSALTAGLLFLLGRRFFGWGLGIATAALFSLSGFHFVHALEARTFVLTGFLATLSLYAFLGIVLRNRKKDIYILCFANILLAYTHFATFPWFILQIAITMGIGFLVLRKVQIKQGLSSGEPIVFKQAFQRLVMTQGISFIFIAPVLFLVNADKTTSSSVWLSRPDLKALKLHAFETFGGQEMLLLLGAFIAIAFYFAFFPQRDRRFSLAVKIIAALGLGSLLVTFLISQWIPILSPKYQLFTSLPLLLLAGIGLSAIWSAFRNLGLFVTLGVFAFSAYTFLPYFNRPAPEDWKKAATHVPDLHGENSLVMVYPVYQLKSFAYYYDREIFRDYDNLQEKMLAQGYCGLKSVDQGFFEFQKKDQYITVESHLGIGGIEGIGLLEEFCDLKMTDSIPGIRINLYTRKKTH